MNSKIFILQSLLVFLVSGILLGALSSEITIKRGGQSVNVETVNYRGAEYISSNKLAKSIGANYYFNPIRQKSEIKFIDYNLKFTANNQFVILTDKKRKKHQIFQMPISAKEKGGDILIPIKYITKYLSLASGLQTSYNESERVISISSKEIDTKILVDWNNSIIDRNSIKYDIFSAKIENRANGTLLRLAAKRKIRKPTSSISNNTLYIFFSDLTIDKNELARLKTKGFIKNIQVKHINGNPQMELKLREGYDKYEIFYDEEIDEILISIHNKFLRGEETVINDLEKWKFDTVVLDAGHGGKDPGAIGLDGVREKDINLAITKELGELIKNNQSSVNVIYTRNNDSYLELFKRGKIANENDGNLFISIHCNSTPKKNSSASGFEVYLLRPGRTQDAIDIAEFENSVISLEDDPTRYQILNDENFILVSMARSSYMRYSETFAEMLNTEWIKDVKIPSRGIKQAGFYVLVGASMPGVLIETGFISNKNDVKYLKSKEGQNQIAQSIYNSIFKYKNYYETTLNSELDK